MCSLYLGLILRLFVIEALLRQYNIAPLLLDFITIEKENNSHT